MNADQLRDLTLLLILLPGIPVYFAYILGMTAFASYRLAPPPLAPTEYSLVRHLFYIILFLTSLAAPTWCIVRSSLFAPKSDVATQGLTDIDTGLLLFVTWLPWLPLALGIASVRTNSLWIERFFRRPKILLFRPFGDKSASATIFYQLAKVLSEAGRAYALIPSGKISQRRELRNQVLQLALPRLNAIRLFTVPDECWRDRVREHLSDADAVIIDLTHPTESVEWELESALRIVGEGRVILLVQEGGTMGLQLTHTIRYRRPAWLLRPQRKSTCVALFQGALSTIIAHHGPASR